MGLNEKELEEKYQRLVDLYRKGVADREYAQNELKQDDQTRSNLAEKASADPDNEKLQGQLADAETKVEGDKELLKKREGAEKEAREARDDFKDKHEQIAAKVDKQDEMRNEKVEPEKEIEPSTESPGKSKFAQVLGMGLAAHMAGHVDATVLADYERIANPPAITRTYDGPQLTDPSKLRSETEHEHDQEQLDDDAEHLNHSLEESSQESAKRKSGPPLPPSEPTARELADTKTTPARSDDRDVHWTR
jgi:hypothetical protein